MAGLTDVWVNRVGMVVDFMAHFDLGDQVELDYSVESLRALEAAVSAHFADPAEVLYDDEQPFVEGVVGYLGECLLVCGRGHWAWDDASGFAERARPAIVDTTLAGWLGPFRWRFDGAEVAGLPVVSADGDLQLAAVSPLHLLLAHLCTPSTGAAVLSGALEQWQHAVAAHAAAHPEWAQITKPTLTDGMPIMPPSPVLDAWLDEQRRAFPQWASRYEGTWDYSPTSVDALAALVFEITPTVETFEDPANAAFSDTASWYFGEMLCRAYPSRWMYRDHWREPGDPLSVCFTVQTNDNRDFTSPYLRLSNTLRHNDPGRLRAGYDRWEAIGTAQR